MQRSARTIEAARQRIKYDHRACVCETHACHVWVAQDRRRLAMERAATGLGGALRRVGPILGGVIGNLVELARCSYRFDYRT